MRILFATDHAGFALKEVLIQFVRDELGHEPEDCGAHTFEARDDYPDYIHRAAQQVAADPDGTCAIVLGGSGQGEAMVANRYARVRAAVYYGGSPEIVTLSREHNNANVLSLGARFLSDEAAKEAVRVWLATPFSGEDRHARRVSSIETEV